MIPRHRGRGLAGAQYAPAAGRGADQSPGSRSSSGSRAFGSGSRAAAAVIAVALAAGAVAAGILLSQPHGAPRTNHASAKYGQIPSWLPRAKVTVGRIVHASAAHPWQAIEGDTVAVRLASGRVSATAVGPAVPQEGRFPVPATSPCTFTVSFAAASGSVPLRASDFSVLDELGRVHRDLRARVLGGGALPSSLAPGRALSITLYAVLPTGNGRLRWAPQGPKPIVSWDFAVEID